MNEKNSKININIEFNNPCYHCNGDCDACPHWVDTVDYSEIEAEAEAFRISIGVDLRRHSEIKINI